MNNTIIKAEQLTVGYDKNPLIKDINITVNKGEILTLIGPNGAGKTTILKTIINQIKSISGVVYLNTKILSQTDLKEIAQKVSVVLTEKITPERMSVREVVETGRYPYTSMLGILTDKDHHIVNEMLQLVNIELIAEKEFSKISDGQKQRVMLARALCQQPEVLILDEPTSFLDIRYKLEFLTIIQNLARTQGLAVIMSLHEIELAERISDKVACVMGDKIDKFGSCEEIFKDGYIQKLYGLPEESYNYLTGHIELQKPIGEAKTLVIAGGGTGKNIYRSLQRKGIPFYTGIICESDIDYPIAKALAVDVIVYKSFSTIEEKQIEQLRIIADKCDKIYITINLDEDNEYTHMVNKLLAKSTTDKKIIRC